jgi:BASS family bile acid:Na+ symporter
MLAFATVARHPGVALAVAGLTEQPLARAGVLLAVIVNQFAVVPYKLWRRRVHAPVPAVSASPTHSTSGSRH